MSTQKRVTVEGYFHKPQATIFEGLDFLKKQGRMTVSDDRAHLDFKSFLSEDDLQGLLDWHEKVEEKAVSGKLVILVNYEPPYVVDWHQKGQGDHWRESMDHSIQDDKEDVVLFVARLEHLLHLG